jgi:hypothetical protein
MIRAKLISLGGGVLCAVSLLLFALMFAAFMARDVSAIQQALLFFLLAAVGVYLVDSWSEWLSFDGSRLTFDSWFKRKRTVSLTDIDEILLVHQGLNLDRGIISLQFRRPDGDAARFSLGPLWRERDLEAFLRTVEKTLGRKKLLERVR